MTELTYGEIEAKRLAWLGQHADFIGRLQEFTARGYTYEYKTGEIIVQWSHECPYNGDDGDTGRLCRYESVLEVFTSKFDRVLRYSKHPKTQCPFCNIECINYIIPGDWQDVIEAYMQAEEHRKRIIYAEEEKKRAKRLFDYMRLDLEGRV